MTTLKHYKLWDLPVRLSHWLLVIGVVTAFVTAHYDAMDLHQYNGYMLLWVVLFRLLWGITGSTSARFLNFLHGPGAVFAYLRGGNEHGGKRWPGHNPIGGWAVVLMLLALLVQAITGLFSGNEDVMFDGPLVHLVSTHTVHKVSGFHGNWFYFAVLTLLVIHIGANLAYRFVKKQDLITPMITGYAPIDEADAERLSFAPLWRAIACVGLAAVPVLGLLFQVI